MFYLFSAYSFADTRDPLSYLAFPALFCGIYFQHTCLSVYLFNDVIVGYHLGCYKCGLCYVFCLIVACIYFYLVEKSSTRVSAFYGSCWQLPIFTFIPSLFLVFSSGSGKDMGAANIEWTNITLTYHIHCV